MSMETFETCLKFLSADYSERIGLIGGEPTLHPNLKQILARLIDSPFSSVCLFTNGIILQPYFNELRNGKFQILINLNDPRKVGSDRYAQIMDNIDQMVNHLYMRDQVGLGLNLYDPNMDFTFILEALERFRFKKLRVSVAVPNLRISLDLPRHADMRVDFIFLPGHVLHHIDGRSAEIGHQVFRKQIGFRINAHHTV